MIELAENSYVGTVHLGGSERINRFSFGIKLAELVGYDKSLLQKCSMLDNKPKAPRPRDVSFCIKKAQKVLKTELLDIEQGIHHMLLALVC